MADGGRSWYATPASKALSNAKYAEFCTDFGADRVGILTGDRQGKPGCADHRGHHRDSAQPAV